MEQTIKSLSQAVHSLKPTNFGTPKKLPEEVEFIKKRHSGDGPSPDPTDLDKLAQRTMSLWQTSGYAGLDSLSRKEIRWLPWIIGCGKPVILSQSDLFKDILQCIERRWRDGYLQGLINSFLTSYDPHEPGIVILFQLINEKLQQYKGNRANLTRWKEYNSLLFNQDSHISLARWMFDRPPWDYSTLEKLGFRESLFHCSYLNHVARALIDMVEVNFPERLREILSFLEFNGVKPRLRSRNLVREAATKFLPVAGVEASNEIKNLLRPFFLRHLSDPRFAGGRVKWTSVPKDTQKIFTTWLSKEDLEFFFNIVDKTCEDPNTWKYRSDFWKAYLPHIHFTRVVLGSNATKMIRAPEMKRYVKERSPARLKGAGSGQSVFLIGLGNKCFIEWSNSGACRVWPIKDTPFSLEDESYNSRVFYSSCEARFRHIGSKKYRWQEELESWIESNVLPTKPGEFYKLSGKFNIRGISRKESKKRTCPRCGHTMVKRMGRYGQFWGCKGYPHCRYTENIRR